MKHGIQRATVRSMSDEREPLILAIETATRAGSISLARAEVILGSLSGNALSSHSTDLIENVEKLLRGVGTKLSEIDLLAVSSGPGSFTGLRIGLATVKALAVCLGRGCVGVSTLAAIAHAAGPSERNVVALLPAGRDEIFAQSFSLNKSKVRPLDTAAHITPGALLERYGGCSDLTWAGEGVSLQSEDLRAWAEGHNIAFGGDAGRSDSQLRGWFLAPECRQLAVSVAALALSEYHSGNIVSPAELRASYVRPADAEIKERWQHEKSQRSTRI
jgi:tRNA threonylcarbamoyladenosine biosynthesis protein TsaB